MAQTLGEINGVKLVEMGYPDRNELWWNIYVDGSFVRGVWTDIGDAFTQWFIFVNSQSSSNTEWLFHHQPKQRV